MSTNMRDKVDKFTEAVSKHQNGDTKTAKRLYEEVLEEHPDHIQSLCNLGILCKQEKNYTQCLQYLQQALAIDNRSLPALSNLINLYREMKLYDKAIELGKEMTEIMPDNPAIYNNLAITYEMQQEYTAAFEMYQKAIKTDKRFAKAYNNFGVLLYRLGRYGDAAAVFELCLRETGDDVQTLCNAGAVYNKAKRYDEAQRVLQKAIALDHNATGAYVNLGNVYNKVNSHLDALACHTRALELEPQSAANHANLAITYKHLERYKEAIDSFHKALEIDPDFVNAHFDLATTYLALKEYEKGFAEYEWRFKKEEMATLLKEYAYIFEKPKFTTDLPTEGKTLLLYSEQGYGDILQFIRFAEPLKKRYPQLYLKVQCRAALKTVLQTLPFVDEVVSRDEDPGHFDYHYAIMSLPYLLGIGFHNVPHEVYIPTEKQEGVSLVLHPYKYNIGVVWGASVTGEGYSEKTFSPEYFIPLTDHEDIALYALQVGEDVQKLYDTYLERKIIDLSSELTDFQKTASAIKMLDLIITSDTSVAHLAGAMGKEVWVLLPKKADWRWEMENDTCIWYPSARLFRQKEQGKWDEVFEAVFDALEKRYYIEIPRGKNA